MSIRLQRSRLKFFNSVPQFISLVLIVSSAIILILTGGIIWNDISFWNKDLGTILTGSRTGEAISLGIGMTLINYLLVGMSLLIAGVIVLLRNRVPSTTQEQVIEKQVIKEKNKETVAPIKEQVPVTVKSPIKVENAIAQEERIFSGCLHHFGYLSSRPRDSPIPQECIICQRLGDCMVATVYVKKTN
jgi:hypothetical protein